MKQLFLLLIFIFSWNISPAQKRFNNKELAKIGNQTITVGDFLALYKKNNKEVKDTISVEDNLKLYVNFRLKVLEAEKLGLDTLTSFKKELKSYRKQLAKPYFTDKKVVNELAKQAWQRMQYDVRASHILVKLPVNPTPEDTLKAWNKIQKIRTEIINGKNFGIAAQEYSDDASARDQKVISGKRRGKKGNHGDLGYFTVFSMVYPFENAAYNTPVGKISKPIRTRYGYHILKITDKKPALGVAEVEHIFVALPAGSNTKDSLQKSKKIHYIYNQIIKGMSFEEAARKYSEDKGSALLGGKLPRFTSDRIVPQFVETIDTLKRGEISKPFQTIYGFHIIRLIKRTRPGNFKTEEPKIYERIKSGNRITIEKQAVIKRLKKENDLKINKSNTSNFISNLASEIKKGKAPEYLKTLVPKTLFTLGKKDKETITTKEFGKYFLENKNNLHGKNTVIALNNLLNKFIDYKLFNYEDKHLEEKNPEFKELMKEYHDGILLFNITDKMVWSKASSDSAGLKNFYNGHKENYVQPKRIQVITFTFPKNVLSSLEKEISNKITGDTLVAIIKRLNTTASSMIKIDTGTFIKGENKILKHIDWKKRSWSGPMSLNDNTDVFVYIKNIFPKSIKTYNQALGEIISDYQDQLDREWIKQLKEHYEVQINQKTFRKLKRKLSHNKKP